MDINTLKADLLDTLDGIDKERLSLCDLKEYAEILKTVSETQGKPMAEMFMEAARGIAIPTWNRNEAGTVAYLPRKGHIKALREGEEADD